VANRRYIPEMSGGVEYSTELHNISTTQIVPLVLNPLTPELNPSSQRCLTRFLLGIFLLEQCISLIYV
jgi:hypothetical protein